MKDFLLFKIEEKSDQKYHTSLMATLARLENQYCCFCTKWETQFMPSYFVFALQTVSN